jgi:aryl-phospho-beta-D-glucosidase BglC (GH1 family)
MVDEHRARRDFLMLGAAAGLGAALPACGTAAVKAPALAPDAAPRRAANTLGKLPRWRGFNLLEKFTLRDDRPYLEWDFDFLAQSGFDFVRLPTDYRIWTEAPGKYREAPLREIDQAIAWGKSHKVHVNLALHRAPGYCVNRTPPEPLDLFGSDSGAAEARHQFADQWRMLATRYRGVPPSELSFNLVNEPSEVAGSKYFRVAEGAVQAIRDVDPERLIIADGANYGRLPVPELVGLGIAQSTRGYSPFQLSHYRAHWVDGSDQWPVPTWPVAVGVNQYLYGTQKPDFKSALVLRGEFSAGAEVSILVHQVSQKAKLVVRADGATIFEKVFEPGAGQGEWKESVFKPEWNIYQAVYHRTYATKLSANCREIRVELVEGDWLTFTELTVMRGEGSLVRVVPNDVEWGVRQREFVLDARGGLVSPSGQWGLDGEKLYAEQVKPWQDFAAKFGVGIHVGEWGAYSKTPHAVVLAWMKDCLANWQQAGVGWALWNLRGDFGCFDSGRADVTYENYQGHKLDRLMLEILKSDLHGQPA